MKYLPILSRLLIVGTFYEDALRTFWQWEDQAFYLQRVRHIPKAVTLTFLAVNLSCMTIFATCVVLKNRIGLSTAVLVALSLCQAFAFGLLNDVMVLLRTLSVTGGLLLCMTESLNQKKSRNLMFASLPQLSPIDKHKYHQLAGRILLVFLCLGFILNGEWSMLRRVILFVGLAACAMIIIGFQARWSATLLVALLCIINLLVNNWWSSAHRSHQREFLKYDFFQCLSITGGLLSLLSVGPGRLSYDGKRKKEI
ncbi:SURF4-domain-containing protein [Rhizopus microsporus var. microsporus]|uniref:SURF4-domain-containing protein n=2 Tax=Rhizopus microsporus TaxID=58291 RepID=A0A2G4SH92_RHIZD|nr:SURF4-domain-containing protein [Rhizopus microsporus ATCC 52813]ORE10461.1 SURF4-domain-containing protein [Rhizopus microsporus var. microsporus]PHZ08135.1 SURF4-domain-containing protein [Rhizopus microsporus ATCC 52813]